MSQLKRLCRFQSSFQFKLFLTFSLMATLATILLCILFVVRETRQSRVHTTEQLKMLSRHLADSIRLPLYAENREQLQQLTNEIAKIDNINSVVITNLEGRVLAVVNNHPSSDETDTITEIAESRSMPLPPTPEFGFGDANSSPRGKLIGFVQIERNLADLNKNIVRTISVACLFSFFFWLIMIGLSHLVLRRVTHSFNELSLGIQQMQQGDFDTRIDISGQDEPATMADAVNRLAASLKQREEENSRLTQELQESEGTLRNIMDKLPVAVAWTSQDGTVEYVNHFFTQRFGYEPEEIRTTSDWLTKAYPDPCYRKEMEEKRAAALKAAQQGDTGSYSYEAQITCRNGTVRHGIISHQISSRRFISIMVDITERELMQEQAIKLQKLESVGVLAGGIAHNFNNVLTGVLGYISFALRFLDETHKAHRPLVNAEAATHRAADIAKQLLTFARGGAPVKKPSSVRQIVDSSLALATADSCVQTEVELAPDLHAIVADEGQLNQAFYCLALNAVQAMPEGGTLTIRGCNTHLDEENLFGLVPGDYVELDFEDQGCGIAEEHRKQIFVPYFTTRAEIGKGMGLATVHSIITRHGGTVNFQSLQNKGTTFTVLLPSASNWPTA